MAAEIQTSRGLRVCYKRVRLVEARGLCRACQLRLTSWTGVCERARSGCCMCWLYISADSFTCAMSVPFKLAFLREVSLVTPVLVTRFMLIHRSSTQLVSQNPSWHPYSSYVVICSVYIPINSAKTASAGVTARCHPSGDLHVRSDRLCLRPMPSR